MIASVVLVALAHPAVLSAQAVGVDANSALRSAAAPASSASATMLCSINGKP